MEYLIAVVAALLSVGPSSNAMEKTNSAQGQLLAPFNSVGPTSFHIDTKTTDESSQPTKKLANPTAYWIALKDFCAKHEHMYVP